MRFQTNDTVDAADGNLVLTLLERNLLCLALRVDRSGDELRAYGIGPSPRPINAHNTSIFRVEAGQDGRILLTGDVEFQASALMDASAQEPAVRLKIENAVRLTKAEVAMSQIAAGVRSPGAAAPVLVMAAPQPAPETLPTSNVPQPKPEQEGRAPHDWSSAASRADRAPGVRSVADRPYAGHTGGIQSRPAETPPALSKRVDFAGWVARQFPRLITTAAALLLLVATYLFGRLQGRGSAEVAGDPVRTNGTVPTQIPPPEEQLQYDGPAPSAKAASATPVHPAATSSQLGSLPTARAQRQTAQAPKQRSATPDATVNTIAHGEPRPTPATAPMPVVPSAQTLTLAANVAPAAQPTALPAATADRRPDSRDTALDDRLEQWAASMRSTDAAQQASFYADHMDRYFLKTGVSHDFVLRDKAEFLRRGKRVEMFDLEDVAVKDRTDSAARIRLVKHYVVQDGRAGPASEKLVRSELSLRKIEGAWEITGERDFK